MLVQVSIRLERQIVCKIIKRVVTIYKDSEIFKKKGGGGSQIDSLTYLNRLCLIKIQNSVFWEGYFSSLGRKT